MTQSATTTTIRHQVLVNAPISSSLRPVASRFDQSGVLPQNSSPFFSIPWMPFSPFTVCVTWKSTASEQN